MEQEKKQRKQKGLRADNRIQVTYTDGKRPDGAPNRISFYGYTRSEANAKRETYIREKKQGLLPSEKLTTLADWIERWIVMYSIKTELYMPYITKLKTELGRMPIRNIQEAHLVMTLNSFKNKSTSAAIKYRMIIKQCFSRARKNHLITEDPSSDLKLPEDTTEGSHRALEMWETDAVIKCCNLHRAGLWTMLMLLAGLRRGELVALDWRSVDMDKRTITINASAILKNNQPIVKKGAKTSAGVRVIPICDMLYNELNKTDASERSGPVCKSAKENMLTQAAFRQGWRTFCNIVTRMLNNEKTNQQGRRTDIETKSESLKPRIVFSCRPHDLRHTYATALYDAGVDIKSAQYYLGHSDISMTQNLYTHLSQEREKQSRSILVDYLDNWLEKHMQYA